MDALATLLLVALTLTSIIYRRCRGKPVLAWRVQGASFLERFASGHTGDSFVAVGRARSSLLVAVASGRLLVYPVFPFTLMFLPEVWGVELDIPIDRVTSVTLKEGLWRSVDLRYRDSEGAVNRAVLQVRRPEALVEQIRTSMHSGHSTENGLGA